MLEAGDVCAYNVDDTGAVYMIVIDYVLNGVAFSHSGGFMEETPFKMTFDAVTGEGIGRYEGTFLSEQTIH